MYSLQKRLHTVWFTRFGNQFRYRGGGEKNHGPIIIRSMGYTDTIHSSLKNDGGERGHFLFASLTCNVTSVLLCIIDL